MRSFSYFNTNRPDSCFSRSFGSIACRLSTWTCQRYDIRISVRFGRSMRFTCFRGGRGGFSVLIGPTGGYIWGYLSAAVIAGIRSDRIKTDSRNGKIIASLLSVVTCITGTVICYFCGTVQYCFVADIGFIAALAACVIPFIPLDILKCIFAGIFGTELRRILHRAGFNPGKRYKDSSVRDEHAEAKSF